VISQFLRVEAREPTELEGFPCTLCCAIAVDISDDQVARFHNMIAIQALTLNLGIFKEVVSPAAYEGLMRPFEVFAQASEGVFALGADEVATTRELRLQAAVSTGEVVNQALDV